MLIISENEMRQVVSEEDLMEAIEEAFSIMSSGDYIMPERFVAEAKDDKMLYMPCFTNGIIGTKILSAFPENPSKGKPFLDGIMYLNNSETGEPLAILNGRVLTGLRTGAVGGVAMRHLSKTTSKSVGVVGCGAQGFEQIKFACAVRPIEKIYLFDAVKKDLSEFITALDDVLNSDKIEIIACETVEELVSCSDIIVTATGSHTPVLPNDASLLKGKCIVAIGSWRPDMQEIPDALWSVVDTVYTELPYACEESGDLLIPLEKGITSKEKIAYMNDYFRQCHQGAKPVIGETVLYKSVGMSLFDVTSSNKIYEMAKSKKMGVLVRV